jgi:hypothetical protein
VELDTLRAAARRTFGDQAVEQLARRVRRPRRRGTRPCFSVLAGSMGMSPSLKRSFAEAARIADQRPHGEITPGLLLLAILTNDNALADRALQATKVDTAQLQTLLLAADVDDR